MQCPRWRRRCAAAVLTAFLPAALSAQDSDRYSKATGGAVGAPDLSFWATALGISGDRAALLLERGQGTTKLLPPDVVKRIGDNAAGILGVCQVAVTIYQNKEVQWGDVAGLAVTLGSWAGTIPPPFGTLSQLAIATGQAVQANNQAGRDLNFEIANDYYRGAGGRFKRDNDPWVTRGGTLADEFVKQQLDPLTRNGDFSDAFAEYCKRRYHVDHVPLLIQQIDERRQAGSSPIPGELRGLARRFLDEQKGAYHVNAELIRMRAFVQQNLTQIHALSELAQMLRDDPEFIKRYEKLYREHAGRDDEEDPGGATKRFRVEVLSGYDDRPFPFVSVWISSAERTLTTNEQGLTEHWPVPRQLQTLEVVVTAPDHEGFSGPLHLTGQTVPLKLAPTSVEFVVNVTSSGQPVDDATVKMFGPGGRVQTEAAPGGRAVFKLRPGAWEAYVVSPTHAEARQPAPVPLGRPGSTTVVLKRTVPATPTAKPTAVPRGKPGEWVQYEVETRPEKPWKGLRFEPKTGTSVGMDIYNGDVDEHSWNAPPPTITRAGWTANVKCSTQTVKGGREFPIICVDGSGFKEPSSSDSKRIPNQCATCGAEDGKACSASKSFHMTPQEGATSLEIRIGSTYAVTYIYRYKQAQ
jgi:hypothetical protein